MEGRTVTSSRGSRYRLLEVVGKGGFGQVHKATKDGGGGGGQLVAVKIIQKSQLRGRGYTEERVAEEVKLHTQLAHPNVLGLLDAISDPDNFYIVTEFCSGGDLAGELERRRRRTGKGFSEAEAAEVMRQVTAALEYLHKHGIMHRDVKLANVLVSDGGRYKLGDFGLAKMISPPAAHPRRINVHQTLCGTPSSLAPEMASGEPYSLEVDVWALGVMAYTLLVGRTPFDGDDVRDTVDNIKWLRYNIPKELSPDAVHLITFTLTDKQKRLSLQEVIKHPFLRGYNKGHTDSGIGTTTIASSSLHNGTGSQSVTSHHYHYEQQQQWRKHPEIRRPMSEADLRCSRGGFTRTRSLTPLSEAAISPREGPIRPRSSSGERERERRTAWRPAAESTALVAAKSIPPASAANAPKLSARLSTRRLEPTAKPLELRTGVSGEILHTGEAVLEFSIVKKSGGPGFVERMVVSGDGERVSLERRSASRGELVRTVEYSYSSLSPDLYKKYNFAARYVQCLREKTPKVTLHEPDATCHLMENEPVANCEAKFHECGVKITYNGNRDQITYETADGNREDFSHSLSLQLHDRFPLLGRFESLRDECRRVAKGNERLGTAFPVTAGRRPRRNATSARHYHTVQSKINGVGATCSASVSSIRSRQTFRSGVSEYDFADGSRLEIDSRGTDERNREDARITYYEDARGGGGAREARYERTLGEIMANSGPADMRDKVLEAFRRMKAEAEGGGGGNTTRHSGT